MTWAIMIMGNLVVLVAIAYDAVGIGVLLLLSAMLVIIARLPVRPD